MSELKIIEQTLAHINLVFIIFGTIGNMIAFSLLIRKNVRKYSCMRYLATLTLIDILCLYTWNFSLVYSGFTSKKIEFEGQIICRLFSFFCYFILQSSSWLICCIGMDRVITILSFKKKNKLIEILKNTKIVTISTLVAFFLINFAVLIINAEPYRELNSTLTYSNATQLSNAFNRVNLTNIPRTRSSRTYTCYEPKFFYTIWDIVHIVLYSLLPFFVILVENLTLLIMTIRHSKKMRHKFVSYSPQTIPNSISRSYSDIKITFRDRIAQTFNKKKRVYRDRVNIHEYENKSSREVIKQHAKNSKRLQSKTSHVTNLLLFLTVSFFFSTVPYSTFYALRLNIYEDVNTKKIVVGVLTLLQYTRHSANFLIYLFTSSVIKAEINEIIGRMKRKFVKI